MYIILKDMNLDLVDSTYEFEIYKNNVMYFIIQTAVESLNLQFTEDCDLMFSISICLLSSPYLTAIFVV